MRIGLILALVVSIGAQLGALPHQELICRFTGRVMAQCCCPRAAPTTAASIENPCCCDVVVIGATSLPATSETLLKSAPVQAAMIVPEGAIVVAQVPSADRVVVDVVTEPWERGPPPVPVYLRARHLLI